MPAAAQYTAPPPAPAPAPDQPAPKRLAPQADEPSARDASVLRRERGDPPDGFPIGSFTFFPRLEVDGEYDDNVYRTRRNRKGDFIFRARPSFTLASDWGQHALALYASADVTRYIDQSKESYVGFAVGARGSVDITDEWRWNTNAEFARVGLGRGSPGLLTTGFDGRRQIVNVITAATELAYNGDLFYGRIGPRFRRFEYVRGVSTNENFNVYDISARLGYRITPELSVFIDPSYEWVRYDRNGAFRNNQGFDIRGGVAYDVTRTLTAELGFGYFRRTYSGIGKPQDGLSFLGRLFWNPLDNVSIEAEARRSFSQYRAFGLGPAAIGNAVETSFSLRAGWEPFDPLLLDAGVSYARYRYEGEGLRENFWLFDVGAKYFFNKNFYAGPRYLYERRNAKPRSANYTDNRFLITLGAQF